MSMMLMIMIMVNGDDDVEYGDDIYIMMHVCVS